MRASAVERVICVSSLTRAHLAAADEERSGHPALAVRGADPLSEPNSIG